MSSPYSILNNRPVDQWKVTELKEELRRRRMKTNGLKEELVRRLDGALRLEQEEADKEEAGKEELDNGLVPENDTADNAGGDEPDPVPAGNNTESVVNDEVDIAESVEAVDTVDEEKLVPMPQENNAEPVEVNVDRIDEENLAPLPQENDVENVHGADEVKLTPLPQENSAEPIDDNVGRVDAEKVTPLPAENNARPSEDIIDKVEEENLAPLLAKNNAEPVEGENDKADDDTTMVDNIDITADVNNGMEVQDQKEMGNTTLDAEFNGTTGNVVPLENNVIDNQTGVGQLVSCDQDAEKMEDLKASAEDVAPTSSQPTNQVPEVSPDLEFQVKSESISTDSVSINEKNELKDNLNANNFHLELEVVKPEMVQPSSCDFPIIGGNSSPLKDDKVLVDNRASLDEAGYSTCATDMEICKKTEVVEEGSPEKLNLDRSSGDESMEEDILESKQIESKNNSEGAKKDIKENAANVLNQVDTLEGGCSPKKITVVSDEENKPTSIVEKRKAKDQQADTVINEPKRQRRWNAQTIKAAEPQASNVTISAPEVAFQPVFRRSFSRSDSSLSSDAPKERIVPPSQKPATTSLRIDRFLRPFTLKAVQELLAKTGTVTEFWMDQIKTHCYVTYSSVEEATATRNALYNFQWPTNGGRLLIAEFVDRQEVKARLEAPPLSPAPVTPSPTTPTAPPFQRQPQGPSRPNNIRQQPPPQQLPPPPPLPSPPTLSNPPQAKEWLPPPPPLHKKPDPPILTLDDLFKKTKATPRIYYLPLSEEQVAAKLEAEKAKGAKE